MIHLNDKGINGGLSAAFYTLGCRVNQYETDSIEQQFIDAGYVIKDFSEDCDVYVINTCTVTAESDRKSRQIIRRTAKAKKNGALVVVCGCYSQRDPGAILAIPEADIVLGNTRKSEICDIVSKVLLEGANKQSFHEDISTADKYESTFITKSERTRAFIKICDGCENHCSYCIIPSVRGKVRSRSKEEILCEINALIKSGYSEFVLTGIETAAYGKDLSCFDSPLASLLEDVASIPEVKRIRLGSMEPTVFTPEFVARISKIEKLMPHFHLSLQSGSDEVLRKMKRKYNTKMYYDVVTALKNSFKDIQLTTDVIAGFPGETEENHIETENFIKKCAFSHCHIFPYSNREGTVADTLPDQLNKSTKKNRALRLERISKEIRDEILAAFIGKSKDILVETYDGTYYTGYTDNYLKVLVKSEETTDICGKILSVIIDGATSDKEYGSCLTAKFNHSAI